MEEAPEFTNKIISTVSNTVVFNNSTQIFFRCCHLKMRYILHCYPSIAIVVHTCLFRCILEKRKTKKQSSFYFILGNIFGF